MKITFVAVILAIVRYPVYSDDVVAILGELTALASFPALPIVPVDCVKFNITRVGGTCECGNRTGIPRLAITAESVNQDFVPVIAKSVDEVPSLSQYKCTCGGKKAIRLVYMPVDDNYIIQYEVPLRQYGENKAKAAILISRKIPTRAELDNTIANLPDLRNREYEPLCNL